MGAVVRSPRADLFSTHSTQPTRPTHTHGEGRENKPRLPMSLCSNYAANIDRGTSMYTGERCQHTHVHRPGACPFSPSGADAERHTNGGVDENYVADKEGLNGRRRKKERKSIDGTIERKFTINNVLSSFCSFPLPEKGHVYCFFVFKRIQTCVGV